MSAIPKYRAIFETLREDILSGRFAETERFPSEEQLIRRFHVSRNTVRSALVDLKRAGIIETRNGSGTYLSSSATDTTGTLGLIVPGIATAEIFPRICARITSEARKAGFATIFGDASSADPDVRTTQVLRLAHDYANRKVDGVILEPIELVPDAGHTTTRILTLLERRHIPVVLLDRDASDEMHRSKFDLVGIDNFRTGYALARHLVEQGAKRIHTLIRPNSAPTVRKRAKGVREALLDAGLPCRPSQLHEFDPSDVRLVRKAFVRKADAVVCGNDITAAMLIGSLSRIGLRVPDDLLVVGVDDVRLATVLSPNLTTMRQPCEEIADAAVRMLLERIADSNRPARETLLDTTLVVRTSSVRKSRRSRQDCTTRSPARAKPVTNDLN